MHKLYALLAAMLLVTACDRAPAPEIATLADVPSENRIRNFHTVTPDLFRSGKLLTRDFALLEDLGVRTILSLEKDGDRTPAIRAEESAAREHGIVFRRIQIDGSRGPTLAQLEEALAVIGYASLPTPLLVHCLHGQDRTGLVVAAYRIRHDGWTVEAATSELRRYGHMPQLYWWDDVLYDL